MITLLPIKRTDPRMIANMDIHYSHPKGFVGRNICYVILYDNIYYGTIAGGSASLHLPNRNEFFNNAPLNNIVNNIFYHVEKVNGQYPIRNFTVDIMKYFRERIIKDWKEKYGDEVIGFETLVELPRIGELYIRDGWSEIGITKGYTCRRISGESSDGWTGRRVWNTKDLRPKRVFARKIE